VRGADTAAHAQDPFEELARDPSAGDSNIMGKRDTNRK
jgi:hypothetical protein